METSRIKYARIFPSIGIARVGNSPEEYFIGPEAPGHPPEPAGGFKDKRGRVKRQAARFRVYGFDEKDQVVGELTEANASITWSVHLANRKAGWHRFAPEFKGEQPLRNGWLKGDKDRQALDIDPGARSVSGRRKSGPELRFDSGTFLGINVPLGEVRTDSCGRLLVLGGMGHSASTKDDNPITQYANNHYWYDDTSDGPVSATVTLRGQDKPLSKVDPARVLVTPPDFAPEIRNLVTLYEVMRDVEIKGAPPAKTGSGQVSFARDIYPILSALVHYQWVNEAAHRGHGPGKRGAFLGGEIFKSLSSNKDADKSSREAVFKRIRNPILDPKSPEAEAQANRNYMPPMAGDNAGATASGAPTLGHPGDWFFILPSQYLNLKSWAEGKFASDWNKNDNPETGIDYPAIEEIPVEEQPAALTRGALEPCVGAPFCPGIEMTYVSRQPQLYSEPFRLCEDIEPGGITKYMALPWQADFYECNTFWWPAQRPDDVIPESEYVRVVEKFPSTSGADSPFPSNALPGPSPSPVNETNPAEFDALRLAYRTPWARGVEEYTELTIPTRGDNAMVELWSQLGFVRAKQVPTVGKQEKETVYIETERTPYVGIDPRQYYYTLANIENNIDFIPKAREITDYYLKLAWDSQKDHDFPASWLHFPYSDEAFEARLNLIYNDLVNEWRNYDPAIDPLFKTREDVIQWMVQMAPFNQNDGAWLHSITPAGPLNDVQSMLFSIWMDEAGDGKVQWSHCNLYTATLEGLGYFFPETRSHAYAYDERFLDSAFTVPMLELAIAQFPETYFPELLGFTLQLEWTVISLEPMVMLLEYYDIDPHFYRLHIGIDNASEGHGAIARDAVRLYLDQVRTMGGEDAVQEQWRRIWTGFIAFGATGTLGHDLAHLLRHPPSLNSQVEDIIRRKKPYGSLNHGEKKLGPNRINDWFNNPPEFREQLVKSGIIVPGDPDNSPFFKKLTSFQGPMFKVFTDAEMATWRAWTLSLAEKKPPAKPDYAVEMAKTIDALSYIQSGTPEHDSNKLKGLDPQSDPPKEVEQSVGWWFDQVTMYGTMATAAFMTALARPDNGWITPGDPDASRFVTSLLSQSNLMGQAFAVPQPGTEHPETGESLTRRDIAIEWIREGCKIPKFVPTPKKRYSMFAPPPQGSVYPEHRIHGQGGIH